MTKFTMSSTADEEIVGQRVESGEGDDYDTGTVARLIRPGVVEVAWDSGVRTAAATASLRAERSRWVIQGRGERGDWSREYVEAGGDALYDSEQAALSAIDSLIDTCGWSRDELRVREA